MHPSLVLAAYTDELVAGARVAMFGDATLELPLELLDRGARLVHVYDVEPARIAEATARGHERSLYYGALRDEADIGVRDGAFDIVFVPDLSFTERPNELVALVRRVLSGLGAAVFASPNPDVSHSIVASETAASALGYYELYDAIARHFPRVRMVGQVPFVGYTMAEFSATAEEIEPTIDTSLATRERDPEWFVALASARPVRLDSFAIVEIPHGEEEEAEELGEEGAAAQEQAGDGEDREAWTRLERERDDARASFLEEKRGREEERDRAVAAEKRATVLEQEIAQARDQTARANERLQAEELRRSSLEAENSALRRDPEVERLRERIGLFERQVGALSSEHEKEVDRLEAQLQERGREARDLREEVARRERLVREMLARHWPQVEPKATAPSGTAELRDSTAVPGSLSAGDRSVQPQPPEQATASDVASPSTASASASPPTHASQADLHDLRARLDTLAGEVSRREADLIAAGWKIAQLERQLAQVQR